MCFVTSYLVTADSTMNITGYCLFIVLFPAQALYTDKDLGGGKISMN